MASQSRNIKLLRQAETISVALQRTHVRNNNVNDVMAASRGTSLSEASKVKHRLLGGQRKPKKIVDDYIYTW